MVVVAGRGGVVSMMHPVRLSRPSGRSSEEYFMWLAVLSIELGLVVMPVMVVSIPIAMCIPVVVPVVVVNPVYMKAAKAVLRRERSSARNC